MQKLTENAVVLEGSVNHTPTLGNRLSRIARTFRFRGAKASVLHYAHRTVRVALRRPEPASPLSESATSERFAQADAGDARLQDLVIQSPNHKWGLPYAPVIQEVFGRAMQHLSIPFADYDFIDLGAGKGLPLLLAAGYSFKRITGVEYAKVLAETATLNIKTFQQETGSEQDINCIWGDATEFDLPTVPTVLYLNNPFQGQVMDRVLANIEESLRSCPRDVWVVYGIPWEARKFDRSPMLVTIEANYEYCVYRSVVG